MYDYPKLKKDISNTGVGILELSNTTKEYIRELNKISLKGLITFIGELHLDLTDVPLPANHRTLISKLKEKIIDINETIKSKDITYTENIHRPNDTNPNEWYFSGSYEKLTILRKWLVDNYKKSIYQMWYEIPLQNNKNPSGVDVTKIHQELTKIYLELYGHLEEVQNFGREYNPELNLNNQVFRLQVFEEGCFIEPHFDGNAPDGHCVLLVYTNEDYVEGKGGELVSEYKPGLNRDVETITVPPTIGTLVVVDLKNDPCHAVNVVKEKDWMRTVIRSYWPAGVEY
jgi:hypothetical protein